MTITRLTGGLTPADGSDPRTFPAIWNDAVDDIEQLQSDIADLPASAITSGTLDAARIPNLDASKITSGTFTGNGSGLTTLDASNLSSGTVANARLGAGTIIQVVQTTKTNVFTTSSTTFGDITNFSATITPSSTSSKILVMVDAKMNGRTGVVMAQARLMRNSTAIYIGDAAGSRTRVSGSAIGGGEETHSVSIIFLDAPNTTSSLTYKLQMRANTANTVSFNTSNTDTDDAIRRREASSITLLEVKG